ncbi:MAG: hypothetical protein R2695_15900 [Acidimicrobiales bacterium]
MAARRDFRDAAYYEAVLLDDVDATLSSLGLVRSRPALLPPRSPRQLAWAGPPGALTDRRRPPSRVESLAAGELDTRLDPPTSHRSLRRSSQRHAGPVARGSDRARRGSRARSHELRSPLMTSARRSRC